MWRGRTRPITIATEDSGVGGSGLVELGAVDAGATTRTWGLGDVWITLGLYVVFAFAAAAIVLAVPDTADAKAWALVASLALPWIGLAGWPLWVTARKGAGPILDLRLRASWRDVVFGACAGFLGLVLASAVAWLLERITDSPLESAVGQLADDLDKASPWPVLLLAVLAAVGAPIVEEIAFRGLMFGSLVKRGWSPWPTILVTGFAFALFHLEPTRLPVLLVIGVVLGFVRARTGSTSASIAAHMANNLPGAIALGVLAFQ
jgi:membrane protease YdiL (CAAX protease family)